MSYQEKRTVVSMMTSLLLLISYGIYSYGKYQSGALAGDNIKAWASVILFFIVIGAVAAVVIQIIFHVMLSVAIAVQEKVKNSECHDTHIERVIETEMVTDEMDKLIELKSIKLGFFIAGIGFVLALITQMLNYPPAMLLHVMFIAFMIGSLLESVSQIYFYRRGV